MKISSTYRKTVTTVPAKMDDGEYGFVNAPTCIPYFQEGDLIARLAGRVVNLTQGIVTIDAEWRSITVRPLAAGESVTLTNE